jgi:hypothetical protein
LFEEEEKEKYEELLKSIASERSHYASTSSDDLNYKILPIKSCADKYGSYEYDPLFGQLEIEASKSDGSAFPTEWILSEKTKFLVNFKPITLTQKNQKFIISTQPTSNQKGNSKYATAEDRHAWHRAKLSLYYYAKSDYKQFGFIDKLALDKGFEEQKSDISFDVGKNLETIQDCLSEFTICESRNEFRNRSHGILLYGPPGTGKTELSKVILKKGGLYSLVPPLVSSEVNRSLVGETEELIAAIWNRAKICPHVLCCIAIDEVDALAPKRTNETSGHKIDALSILLALIGGIKDVPNVYVIAATNRLNKIDDAFLRRLQDKLYIGKLTST